MGDTSAYTTRGYALVPRSKYLVAAAAVALCLCLFVLVDLFQLPFASSSLGRGLASGSVFSTSLITGVLDMGYVGLFVLMLLESASLPVPSEIVLPFAGYLVFTGRMDFTLALLDSTVAGVMGALIDYYLALKLGRPFMYRLLGRFGVKAEHIDRGERWVDSKGAWSVLLARFVPALRTVISIPAGLLRMEVKLFTLLTLVGSFAWSALLIYLGYTSGSLWEAGLNSAMALFGQTAVFVVAGISLLYIGYYFLSSSSSVARAKSGAPPK